MRASAERLFRPDAAAGCWTVCGSAGVLLLEEEDPAESVPGAVLCGAVCSCRPCSTHPGVSGFLDIVGAKL